MTDELSARELEVLKLLVKGFTYQEIAIKLAISTRTVEAHIAHIAGKLFVHGRFHILRQALLQGIISVEDLE